MPVLIDFSVDLSQKKKKKLKGLHVKIMKFFDTSHNFHIVNVESTSGISRWLNKAKKTAARDVGIQVTCCIKFEFLY